MIPDYFVTHVPGLYPPMSTVRCSSQGAWVARFVGDWHDLHRARGLALVPELLALLRGSASPPPRYAVFPLVALTAGLAYLVGTWRARENSGCSRRPVPSPSTAGMMGNSRNANRHVAPSLDMVQVM